VARRFALVGSGGSDSDTDKGRLEGAQKMKVKRRTAEEMRAQILESAKNGLQITRLARISNVTFMDLQKHLQLLNDSELIHIKREGWYVHVKTTVKGREAARLWRQAKEMGL